MDPPNISKLHAQAQQDRISFLKTDLALCSTFADLADTELRVMGHGEATIRAQGKAEEGHARMTELLVHIDDSVQRDGLQKGLNDLRAKLNILRECVDSSTQD